MDGKRKPIRFTGSSERLQQLAATFQGKEKKSFQGVNLLAALYYCKILTNPRFRIMADCSIQTDPCGHLVG